VSALLLDASVILAAFDDADRQHEAAVEIVTDNSLGLATIDLARYEVANVAVRAWELPQKVAPLLGIVDRIAGDGSMVHSESGLLARAAEIAGRHGLSVYDATYVAAAGDTGRLLISCDIRDLVSKGLAISPEDLRKR
jgi:predicted nucleic acid-binding protein